MRTYDLSIVNTNIHSEMREKYACSKEWRIFANTIPKHPYIKSYLYEKYEGLCQFCKKPLKPTFQVHHISYDCVCINPNLEKVAVPTPKKPNRNIYLPHCESCENIEVCTINLRPVCKSCNMIISKIIAKQEHGEH